MIEHFEFNVNMLLGLNNTPSYVTIWMILFSALCLMITWNDLQIYSMLSVRHTYSCGHPTVPSCRRKEVLYLGHVVFPDGVKPDPY